MNCIFVFLSSNNKRPYKQHSMHDAFAYNVIIAISSVWRPFNNKKQQPAAATHAERERDFTKWPKTQPYSYAHGNIDRNRLFGSLFQPTYLTHCTMINTRHPIHAAQQQLE